MIFKTLLNKLIKYKDKKVPESRNHDLEQPQSDYILFSKDINHNTQRFAKVIGTGSDIKQQELYIGQSGIKAVVFYLDGMTDSALLNESVIRPLKICPLTLSKSSNLAAEIKNLVIHSGEVMLSNDSVEITTAFLAGDTILFVDTCDYVLIIGTKSYETRGITEPQTELVVRGPREGFNENLRTNTSLIRRIVRNPDLRMEALVVGKQTKTNLCIVYIKDIANDVLIKEVRRRLASIDVDAILDSGYIEEYIEDAPLSLFPTVGYTEKPDVVSAKILEGRVAIIVDGSPLVLTVPHLFIENLQTAEDYYTRPIFATFLRAMRLFSYFISIFLVPMFVAMTTYHQELIPTTLLFTIIKAREGTPFPAVGEAFVLIVSFEILREAGLRLPRPIGQAISIVGAIIMGDAAVAAGLVGAPMVIMVAISAVATFIVPEQVETISLLRYAFMIVATILGGFGIAVGFLVLITHLASLTSFGVPYFNTFLPTRDQQDGVLRLPLWLMTKRPQNLLVKNVVRNVPSIPPTAGKVDNFSEGVSDYDDEQKN